MTVLVDISWPVVAKASLQRAVREGVRQGVTLTASQMAAGATLTSTVKGIVQSNAMGLLNGSTGLSYIQVNYFAPPPPGSTSGSTNVSGLSTADASGNIMQVSVVGFPVTPLMPVMGLGGILPSTIPVTVFSSDIIEPDSNPPPVGSAP